MPSAFDYREMASEHLKEAATTKDAARKKVRQDQEAIQASESPRGSRCEWRSLLCRTRGPP